MGYESIHLTLEEGVATLTLNRPDRLNSFTVAMHKEVQDAFATIGSDSSIRAVLITGAGRGFCAGQDLSDEAVMPKDGVVDLGQACAEYWNPLIRHIAELPMPVICAVNGVAAGAGANVALACDIVLASDKAKFIQSFANIGLIPDSGGTWILPRLIGQARAMAIALTGQPVTAEQAENWGMIWRKVEHESLMEEALNLAKSFAIGPTKGLAETKKRLRNSALNTLNQELDLERDAMAMLGRSHDYSEGVAAFMAKRKPSFKGQ